MFTAAFQHSACKKHLLVINSTCKISCFQRVEKAKSISLKASFTKNSTVILKLVDGFNLCSFNWKNGLQQFFSIVVLNQKILNNILVQYSFSRYRNYLDQGYFLLTIIWWVLHLLMIRYGYFWEKLLLVGIDLFTIHSLSSAQTKMS